MIENILSRLDKVKKVGKKWMARCPGHADGRPSLMISEDNDKVSVHCFAGCSVHEIMAGMGLEAKDLYPQNQSQFDKDKWRLEKLSEESLQLSRLLGMYHEGMDKGILTDDEKSKFREYIVKFNGMQKQIKQLMR